jgi:hypothetical protein
MTIERGTTQAIDITIRGWDLTGCNIYTTFKQGKKILTKDAANNVTYTNNATKFSVTLSQSETMMFEENAKGKAQVRWVNAGGAAYKTKPAEFNTDELLYEKLLVFKEDGGDG